LKILRLGTRKSALALAQSGAVARALEAAHPGLAVELVPIVTRGDRYRGELAAVGGKGLFTRELEAGLAAGDLDLAVHSLKDLPAALPTGLAVAAFPPRADPRDALISEVASDLGGLPPGAVVLTGSLRRRAQLLLLNPRLEVAGVRGNVGTRLERWREGGAAAVVLARAGLDRLGLRELPAHPLDPEVFLPAPGQGTLALEVKAGSAAHRLCAALDHPETARCARAERAVVAAFGGDCTLPLAAWARVGAGGELRLSALLATPDGRRAARAEAVGDDPEQVAADCARALAAAGAAAVLAAIREQGGAGDAGRGELPEPPP
jgi:hydroxymethylbilane synthase